MQYISNQDASLHIPFKPWTKKQLPLRILAIRLQAMGDLVITLPYLQHLRNHLPPNTKLDLLTREEVEAIPKSLYLFDRVYSIGGGRNGKKQVIYSSLLLPKLLLQKYDVVIDLQNNKLSRAVRKILRPSAWSEFDRYAPVPAGECTRLAIEAIGIGKCEADPGFKMKMPQKEIADLLQMNGWDGSSQLVVLNPAGAFTTRNWPMEYYVAFANIWLHRYPNTQFVAIGVSFIEKKVNYLKEKLDNRFINLVNKTTPVQAFALIQNIQFILTEDSGLMHMAWVSGIPTLAIFGSTKSYRATPLGPHSLLLNSADLACGNCMLEDCLHGDNRCLTRYTPEFVFDKALTLLNVLESKTVLHV